MADEVTMEEAARVAANALGSDDVEYVWNGLGEEKYGTVDPAFYVFEGNGQWAVIAADDCAVPVLMHGYGEFDPDTIPDNMRHFLEGIGDNIREASSHGLAQAPEVGQRWAVLKTDSDKKGRPGYHAAPATETLVGNELGTALWNQGVNYYTMCPTYDDKPCYAGCVATAMTIIMRHFQWPETGVGVIPSYTTRTHRIVVPEIDIDGYEFDWENLPMSRISSEWTKAQADKLALNMYYCGAMVEMDYTPDGSGAYTDDAIEAMATHCSYSADARELYRSSYSNQEWLDMIKAEIDADHPLMYGGYDVNNKGGHQFVCDGYNSNNEIHMNWGWSGSYNGWYAVCYLGAVGGDSNNYVFSKGDSAVFGLVPDYTGAPASPKLVVSKSYSGGITITGGTIAEGGNFTLRMSSIKNVGSDYEGATRAALLSKSGAVKEFISSESSLTLRSANVLIAPEYSCSIEGDIAAGDYISIMYEVSSGTWAPIGLDANDNTGTVVRLNALDILFINSPSSFTPGQLYYPSLTLGHKRPSTVKWYLDDVEFTPTSIEMPSGNHTFKVTVVYSDSSTETVLKKVSVE